jgi:tetratricopeptide (TPR) repeat protein
MYRRDFITLLTPKYSWQKVLLYLLVALVWANPCAAQNNNTDSLITLLKHHRNAGTQRIELLNKISNNLFITDFKKGLQYNDTAIAMARKIGSKPLLADAILIRAKCLSFKNDFKDAIRFGNEALQLFSVQNNRENIAECYLVLANNNYALANYVNALEYAKKALQVAYTTGNKLLIARSLNAVGLNYGYLSNYTEAIAYHLKQLKIYEDLHDEHGMVKALGNIGVVYYNLKRYPEAIKYTEQCLITLQRLDDKLNLAAALNNIGGFYLEMGDYKRTIDYNEKALFYNKIINSRKGIANDLMDIGVAYFNLKQYRQAIAYLGRSIAIYDSLGAKNNLSAALGHLAALYAGTPANELSKAGIAPQGRYYKAITLQLKAINLARHTNDRNNESAQWQRLSSIYTQQKNYKQAFESYQSYINLRDSIINDKKKQEIARLSMQYDFDKKEADIKITNDKKQVLALLEISRQKSIRNAFIVTAAVVIIASVMIFIFYERRKHAIELQKEAELKARISDTEMKALRLQLNPHFIFNSLNSISYYINRHDKDTADTYLTKFARLMRLVLENSEHKEISLNNDLQTLELYMQMEALRLEHKFTYHIMIEEDIDPDNVLVPPMVMQPFVENSIWHGIAPKKGSGTITISIKLDNEMLVCIIEDDGVGRKHSGQSKAGNKKSFGLKVIQARMDVINETRQVNAGVEIIDLKPGTKAIITLPYQINF